VARKRSAGSVGFGVARRAGTSIVAGGRRTMAATTRH
jgi:hypothetical protein